MEMKIFVVRMHYNNNTKVGKVKNRIESVSGINMWGRW